MGLYHIIRNPAYTVSIISLLGVVIAVIIICFTCYRIRINIEENVLNVQSKKEFEQYCNQMNYRLIARVY